MILIINKTVKTKKKLKFKSKINDVEGIEEDRLMQAEIYAHNKNYKSAYKIYALISTNKHLNKISYDDTSICRAAKMGKFLTGRKLGKEKFPVKDILDYSYRANLIGIELYAAATNAKQALEYEQYYFEPYSILKSDSIYIKFCRKIALKLAKYKQLEKIIKMGNMHSKTNPKCLREMGQQWYAALYITGNYKDGNKAYYEYTTWKPTGINHTPILREINNLDMNKIYKKSHFLIIGSSIESVSLGKIDRIINGPRINIFYDACLENLYKGNLVKAEELYEKCKLNWSWERWIKAEIYLASKEYQNAYQEIHDAHNGRDMLYKKNILEADIQTKLFDYEKIILKKCYPYLSQEHQDWCSKKGVLK